MLVVWVVLRMSCGVPGAGNCEAAEVVSLDGFVLCAATKLRRGRKAHRAQGPVATIEENISPVRSCRVVAEGRGEENTGYSNYAIVFIDNGLAVAGRHRGFFADGVVEC